MNVTFRNAGFEYSIESILLFQTEDTNSYWSDSLYYFYPEINRNIQALQEREKEDYLRATLQKVWDRVLPEIEAKEYRYHEHFQKYRNQIEDALSDAFELDSRTMFNELLANITLNPICPRFLQEEKFDLFYMNSERGALGITLHEVIHYFWFFVWNRHFQDSYDEYETPSLQWILSTINPYYPRKEGACVYRYFLDMKIEGKLILDTLMDLHENHSITAYMEAAYDYCKRHEAEIRQHIRQSENSTAESGTS